MKAICSGNCCKLNVDKNWGFLAKGLEKTLAGLGSTLKVLRETCRRKSFFDPIFRTLLSCILDVFTEVIHDRRWVPKNRGSTDPTDASDYSNWSEDTLVRVVLQIPLGLTTLVHFFITRILNLLMLWRTNSRALIKRIIWISSAIS
nr:hypothetical protein [Tanacetum cinerariifolium]